MRLLLDEDVHAKVLGWLAERGHDVVRVPSGLKNGDVISLAQRESRILVTRDKDFTNRLMYPPRNLPGLIVLRIHPPQLEKLLAAVRQLLDELSENQLRGKLAIVEEKGYHLLL